MKKTEKKKRLKTKKEHNKITNKKKILTKQKFKLIKN